MGATASQITSLPIVYSTVYSGADQRKHQSSASLAFVRGIHQWPVNSLHKWPVTRKMFPFDDVMMWANVNGLWCEKYYNYVMMSSCWLGGRPHFHNWSFSLHNKSGITVWVLNSNESNVSQFGFKIAALCKMRWCVLRHFLLSHCWVHCTGYFLNVSRYR